MVVHPVATLFPWTAIGNVRMRRGLSNLRTFPTLREVIRDLWHEAFGAAVRK